MPTLTVVCPAYNEAPGIESFYKALRSELTKLARYKADIVFVVDGSTDATFEILAKIAQADDSVRVIRFSKNFGHQMALLAGIDHATGNIVVMMDSDLQHPPSVIPKLLAEYEKGNEIVYTVRVGEKIGAVRKIAGSIFYRFVNVISDIPINENASDFRLISRRVAEVLKNEIHERDMFLRGMMGWMGFKQAVVRFKPDARVAGKSNYSLGRLVALALSGAVSFSKKPLRAAGILGFFFASFGFLFALYTAGEFVFADTLPPGWATIVVLLSVFGGLQLIFLGILGEYIGVIFDEVKARPRYIIESAINIHKKKQ